MSTEWYKSDQDGGIEYRAERGESGDPVTVDYVIFTRYNEKAGVREHVAVHWTNAFKWADFDPCGGLQLSGVKLSNGSEPFASGLYFNDAEGGLCDVIVGCYGSSWLRRKKVPKRNEHGYPIREEKEGVSC